jgi:hypothetical protein
MLKMFAILCKANSRTISSVSLMILSHIIISHNHLPEEVASQAAFPITPNYRQLQQQYSRYPQQFRSRTPAVGLAIRVVGVFVVSALKRLAYTEEMTAPVD